MTPEMSLSPPVLIWGHWLGSLPNPPLALFQLGITGSQRRQEPREPPAPDVTTPRCVGATTATSCPLLSPAPRNVPKSAPGAAHPPPGASGPDPRRGSATPGAASLPPRRGDTGTRGEVTALTGHRVLLYPSLAFPGSGGEPGAGRLGDKGQGTGPALGTKEQRWPRWGGDNFPQLWTRGSAWLQKPRFGSQQEFPSPPHSDGAALEGLGLGRSQELDRSISIASAPKFGDTVGGHTGPRNPPAPPSLPHFGNSDAAAAQPPPGCWNGADECFGLLWEFFFFQSFLWVFI